MRFFLGVLFIPLAWGQICAPVQTLAPVASVSATVSAANCRLPDGTLYAEFSLTLPTQGEVELSVDSGTLLVRDSSGRKLVGGASVRTKIERGTYSVLINAPEGTYALRSSFTPEAGTLCREYTRVGPNQTLIGRLGAANCRLPDNTPFDGYVVSIFGSGTLDISAESGDFSPYLILRTVDGRALVSGENGKISTSVQGDQEYRIIAAASEGQGAGDYRLSVNFKPADDETCRPLPLGIGEVKGTISAESCEADRERFNYYELQVTESGSSELELSSSAFNTGLVLLDAAGRTVARDQQIVRAQLETGTYRVLVLSLEPSGGDYTLKHTFLPGLPENCPLLNLAGGAIANGNLSAASSCRSQEGLTDTYRIVLSSPGTLEVTLASGDFEPLLILRDEKGNRILSGVSPLVADLPEGTYTVAVGSSVPGGYAISWQLTSHPLTPCSKVVSIGVNSGYIGVLSAGSCQPADYYEFSTATDGVIAAVMTSADLDSFLTLENPQGGVLRSDDNSYGGSDSILTQFLPAGTYRLGAHAVEPGGSGYYRVDLLFSPAVRPAACQPRGDLPLDNTLDSRLTFSACQYPDDTFADLYKLITPDAGDIDIRLDSSDIDAFIQLLDFKGNAIGEDDNSGGGSNARLVVHVDPGVYFVVVKDFGRYAVGAYKLAASFSGAP